MQASHEASNRDDVTVKKSQDNAQKENCIWRRTLVILCRGLIHRTGVKRGFCVSFMYISKRDMEMEGTDMTLGKRTTN